MENNFNEELDAKNAEIQKLQISVEEKIEEVCLLTRLNEEKN